jgi:O-antigen ligase
VAALSSDIDLDIAANQPFHKNLSGKMRIHLDRGTARFALLAALIAAAFLFGGSARDDVLSLVILRPLSVLFFGAGLLLLPRDAWRENRTLIILACAFPLLILVHLLPLPPGLWRALPGREFIWQIGQVAGIDQPWRPISLVPYRTWNSFWALFAPLAAFALALGLPRDHSRNIVYAIAIIILASGALGLLQSIGGKGNGFYLYRITNADSAVGLFANRNHQAMLLAIAFPVIAAAASLSKGSREAAKPKLWLAIGVGVMILPFLLVTESRAGLVLGVVGMVSALAVYRDPAAHLQPRRQPIKFYQRWIALGVVAAGAVLTTVLMGRDSSFQRLFEANVSDDLRFRVWGPIAEASSTYFPIGSGIGTFVEVYKIVEPDRNLSPHYLNHAHNDWLEILLTGGLPGLAILAVALWVFGAAAYRTFLTPKEASHTEMVMARLGAAIVAILALASAYDYPLRVPSLACLFAMAAVWLVRKPAGAKRVLRSSAE